MIRLRHGLYIIFIQPGNFYFLLHCQIVPVEKFFSPRIADHDQLTDCFQNISGRITVICLTQHTIQTTGKIALIYRKICGTQSNLFCHYIFFRNKLQYTAPEVVDALEQSDILPDQHIRFQIKERTSASHTVNIFHQIDFFHRGAIHIFVHLEHDPENLQTLLFALAPLPDFFHNICLPRHLQAGQMTQIQEKGSDFQWFPGKRMIFHAAKEQTCFLYFTSQVIHISLVQSVFNGVPVHLADTFQNRSGLRAP